MYSEPAPAGAHFSAGDILTFQAISRNAYGGGDLYVWDPYNAQGTHGPLRGNLTRRCHRRIEGHHSIAVPRRDVDAAAIWRNCHPHRAAPCGNARGHGVGRVGCGAS
jgi:hypothetical protein